MLFRSAHHHPCPFMSAGHRLRAVVMVVATGHLCALWFIDDGEGHSLGRSSSLVGGGGPSLLFEGAMDSHCHCCWSMWVGGAHSMVVSGRCCVWAVGGGAVLGDCSWALAGCCCCCRLCLFMGAHHHLLVVVIGHGCPWLGGIVSGWWLSFLWAVVLSLIVVCWVVCGCWSCCSCGFLTCCIARCVLIWLVMWHSHIVVVVGGDHEWLVMLVGGGD